MPKWLMIGINEFGQSRRYTGFLEAKGGSAVSRARMDAEAYYENEFPDFMAAASQWELTRSMATVAKYAPKPAVATWYGMITARARAYADNKRQRMSPLFSPLASVYLHVSACQPPHRHDYSPHHNHHHHRALPM
jgi:hypothetical protein